MYVCLRLHGEVLPYLSRLGTKALAFPGPIVLLILQSSVKVKCFAPCDWVVVNMSVDGTNNYSCNPYVTHALTLLA